MRLVLTVAAVIVGMYGLDRFLASIEQSETRLDAQRLFADGRTLLSAGKPRDAALSFGRAHAMERGNREYETSLASAQFAAGDLETARATLDDVLQDDSNDAQANLLMARVMVAKKSFPDADSYYHRAIYGSWPPHARAERDNTRLELAHLLAKRGSREELLSELLLLQNDAAAANPAREKTVAALFLQAGSPARAADAYRALIRKDSGDPSDYSGLAQAEVMRGNYSAARSAWRDALRLQPGDQEIRSQQEMVEELASMDPTPRRLSTAEKYNRSMTILRLVRDEIKACTPEPATESIPAPAPKVITNELSETVLENAERLWRTRSDVCKQPPEPYDVLPVLMNKLVQ